MSLNLYDVAFLANLDDEWVGPQWPTCTDPAVNFTNLRVYAVPSSSGAACQFTPVLKADAISHALGSDSDVTFHVDCYTVGASNIPWNVGFTCAGGSNQQNNNLNLGMNFTVAELLAGIDLNAADSTSVTEVASGGAYNVRAWQVRVISFNSSACPVDSHTCYDNGANGGDGIQNFAGHVFRDRGNYVYGVTHQYGGANIYDTENIWPQFQTDPAGTASVVAGSTYAFDIELTANVMHYADAASVGGDAFGSTEYLIEIQFLLSGWGNSWTDAIDNDAPLSAGTGGGGGGGVGGGGGGGGGQTFRVTEADCWPSSSSAIFIRYRIKAVGSCGGGNTPTTILDQLAWGYPDLHGTVDLVAAGANCTGGGGGGGGGGGSSYLYSVTPCLGGSDVLVDDSPNIIMPSIGDVVKYEDAAGTEYCGTVSFENQEGVATYTMTSGYYTDCEDCFVSIGSGGGGGGGSSSLYLVTPCPLEYQRYGTSSTWSGNDVLVDDSAAIVLPTVGDVVSYWNLAHTEEYCGTVSAENQTGVAAYEMSSTYTDCEDCGANGLGKGPYGGGLYHEVTECGTHAVFSVADSTSGGGAALAPNLHEVIVVENKSTLLQSCVWVSGTTDNVPTHHTVSDGYTDCLDCSNSLGGGP